MESLSRPLHRRKLSNVTSFSGKNAYDGVFSGHRPKFDGVPAINLEEYREIFSSGQVASSIPVLDLSTLEEASDGLNSEAASMKPDYGKIFGGFRDQDIAISYEELVARNKARAHSSTSQTSQDSSDMSQQSLDDNKQYNMSYNKISQRNKDSLDGTTHVTQLHAVPGFTCFIDESDSQPNNEKTTVTNNVPEKQTSRNNTESGIKHHQDEPEPICNEKSFKTNNVHPSVNSINGDFCEKPTLQSGLESRSNQDESISNDIIFKTNNVHPSVNSINGDFREKPTSENVVESEIRFNQDELLSDHRNLKTFQDDIGTNSSKVSSSFAESTNNFVKHEKRSTATNSGKLKSSLSEEFPPSFFSEEPEFNSASANLRKAIQKAQESIRFAKESVGRKKDGLRAFSNKSFKDTLKVKVKPQPVNLSKNEEKEKDDKMNHNFADGEKLFGAKKIINEIHEKFSESPLELNDDKIDKILSSEPIKNNTFEFENHEKKLEDTDKIDNLTDSKENTDHKLVEEMSNLTIYEKVEDEKKIYQESDQNGYENESSGLLENKKFEEKHEVEDEIELKEEETGEKFYDVCEVETIENSQNYDFNLKTNEENRKSEETLDKFQEPEIYENSSSDYDDAEESESIKVDQNVESSQQNSAHELQVEVTEKDIFENVYADQTASEDIKNEYDDDVSNCSLADVDFEQNPSEKSESVSETTNRMEIEVKQYKETIKQETPAGAPQEPEDACRESEPIKVTDTKRIKEITVEEQEHERIKLAVDRAIREARERAFNEARERAERVAKAKQRVIPDTHESVANDKISLKLKLKAERAAVERATAEARQRALEKAISLKKISEPRVQVNEIKQTSSASHPTAESALRSKAKLEKDNRIMERAAKALAEKEKRDMLVLKEQAERNRLAENLDTDIRRWSAGKEGNLRALLSTLQYILGGESGWQPVSLTEIITSSAVKKAYRKATLCVHPDKLQQRGASIQHKYICEKVFDLLKAAWNSFNSEER